MSSPAPRRLSLGTQSATPGIASDKPPISATCASTICVTPTRSFLVNAGFSLPVIGGLLGHKTPSTTRRYAHLSDETMRAATKSVGKVVSLRRAK